jgi:hypothetical protein
MIRRCQARIRRQLLDSLATVGAVVGGALDVVGARLIVPGLAPARLRGLAWW